MHSKVFSYSAVIQKKHLDMFHHVNNAMYLMIYEEARWDFITKNGYGVEKIRETGLGPTILELKVSFLKELRLGEKITIESHTTGYRNKIGKLAQRMIRGDETCSEAEFTIGLFDLAARKLVAPTEDWLVAVGITARATIAQSTPPTTSL